MSTKASNVLNTLQKLSEGFVSYMILAMILLILFIVVLYIIRISKLNRTECNYMDTLYPSVNGINIRETVFRKKICR